MNTLMNTLTYVFLQFPLPAQCCPTRPQPSEYLNATREQCKMLSAC